MKSPRRSSQSGQAVVEFALFFMALSIMTVGLLDVGRGFFQYNALGAMARYGARWGAIVGGTCVGQPSDSPNSDWCNQYNHAVLATGYSGPLNFWNENGNAPIQGVGNACPASYDQATTGNSYIVGSFPGPYDTSIVGAIKQRYDTNSSSNTVNGGLLSPGFDVSKLKVCIYLTKDAVTGQAAVYPGQAVRVFVYYKFQPASGLLTKSTVNLTAASQYVIQ